MRIPKQKASVLLIVLLFTLVAVTILRAQPSSVNSISFQGALTGANGQALPNGNYSLTFKFYDVPTGGTALATSNVPNVPVTGGIASTPIPVDTAWFNGQTRYLGIGINGGQELSPRVLITAVPYAMNAQSLGNGSFSASADGNFGIGTPSPLAQLHIVGWSTNGPPPFRLDQYGDGVDYGLMITEPDAPSSARIFMENKTLTVMSGDGTSPSFRVRQRGEGPEAGIQVDSPNSQHSTRLLMENNLFVIAQSGTPTGFVLDQNGVVQVRVLRITGGADLAEHLSVTDAQPDDEFAVAPGMVVSIDPTGNRKFKLADEPYDRKRVGIISGGNGVKPGLILRDEGNPQADGEQPIALTGQVWCHADANFGPITPGDLLTTSSTPGHVMKVSDDAKARFAVLGQALTGLKEGRGWVQVLVGKQ